MMAAAALACCPGTAAAQSQAPLDVTADWRFTRASLSAHLGGLPVDDRDWDRTSLDSPWRQQLAAGYEGAIWYRRAVELPADQRASLALLLGPSRHGSYQLWVDGAEVAAIGSRSRILPFPQPRLIRVPDAAARDGRLQLAIRFQQLTWLSEAAGAEAGPFEGNALLGPAPDLASRLELTRLRARNADLASFILGLAFIATGACHLILFSRRRTERTYLWFALGATAFGAHAILATHWVTDPVDHLALTHRLTGIAGHGALVASLLFLWAALDRPVGRPLGMYLASHGVLVLFLALAPFHSVWDTDYVRLGWMIPALIGALVVLVAAMRRGHPDARPLLAGALVLAAVGLGELARTLGVPLPDWVPLAGFAAALCVSAFALTERFSRAHAELGLLRVDLEHRLDQRTRALTDLSRAGERAHRAKREFLANMTHELRTPLNSVIGFANVLLKRDSLTEERERDFLGRIRASGAHLLEVVDDVLDLSRIEAGQLELRPQATRLHEVAHAAAAKHEADARAKVLYLNVRVPSHLNAVQADPQRLEQVLRNLIGNAIKFTRHGGVTVQVEVEGGRPCAIVVEDPGIGIPADQIERVFEPFQQGDSGLSRSYSGSGLGLTISRSLCTMMGCELTVTSEPGAGSRFRVGLPFTRVRSSPPIAADVAEAIPEVEAGRLVLIIDDEADARLLLEEHVRSFGMRAVSASSGLEGLRLARELSPDLVTLDLKMPGLDGWATLRAFKADLTLRNVPVVVVSVIASEARGNFLGQVDLVGKPVDRDALEEAVRRNLRGRASRALVVDDDADSRLLLSSLLDGSVEEVRTASDGIQALAMLETFNPGVILLDLVMPRMDGMTFLRVLRENPRYARTPVLVVTSKELTDAESALLERVTAGVVRKGSPAPGAVALRDRLATFLDADSRRN